MLREHQVRKHIENLCEAGWDSQRALTETADAILRLLIFYINHAELLQITGTASRRLVQ